MDKKTARAHLNHRGASKLDIVPLALLKELINSTFLPDPAVQLEDANANISVASLADKIGVEERTVQRHLHTLEARGLIKINKNAGSKRQNTYTVTLAAVADWPTVKSTRAAKRESQKEADAFMKRFRRSISPARPSSEDYSDLVQYAEIERKK